MPQHELVAWLPRLVQLMEQDPGGRGLAGVTSAEAPGAKLELGAAAAELAERGTAVGIVTGFPILSAAGAAETDGPPGALYFARACLALGMRVDFICDPLIQGVIELGRAHWSLDCEILGLDSREQCLDRGWSHLVSIERPGPTHTLESLQAQRRAGDVPFAAFAALGDSTERSGCRNMRGERLDDFVAPLWQLFAEIRARNLPITTLGLIDGGNEIGAGALPWETIARRVRHGEQIACRTDTDYTLVAGVTDWAAYALSLAMLGAADRLPLAAPWTVAAQFGLLRLLVEQGGLVDGVTGQAVLAVDGLTPDVYLGCLGYMRRMCGLVD